MTPKNASEIKLNSQLPPNICVELKTSQKTISKKLNLESILNHKKLQNEAVELSVNIENLHESSPIKGNLISSFLESNQIKINIKRIAKNVKSLRQSNQLQSKSHLNAAVEIKKEKLFFFNA